MKIFRATNTCHVTSVKPMSCIIRPSSACYNLMQLFLESTVLCDGYMVLRWLYGFAVFICVVKRGK
jgi:hypothetical protein